jgi:hypothetical protein
MDNAVSSSVSDLVRQHVRDVYLRPARRRGERTFAINVGTVHKSLALSNRVPAGLPCPQIEEVSE